MIPMMAAIAASPEGYFDPRGPVAPPPITSMSVTADSVLWSYDAPANFAGYIVKTTTVAGTGWDSATLLGVTINEIVDRSTLPVGTVQVLVKPSIIYEGYLIIESLASTRVNATRVVDDGGPIVGGVFPGGPWTRVQPYASRPNKVFVGSAGALQSALDSADPGDCIVINASFTVPSITVKCKGTADSKIIICSDKDGLGESEYRVLSGGNITVDGGAHFIWRATALDGVHFELTNGNDFQIESNRMVGFNGGSTTSVYTGGYAINCTSLGTTKNVLIAFNRYTGNTATWMHLDPAANKHTDYLITHNHTENTKYGGSFAFGHNPGNAQINTRFRIQYHLDTGRSGTGDQMELKHSGITADKCTFEMASTSGGRPNQIKIRQSALDDADVDILEGRGTNFLNLLIVTNPTQDAAQITVRGRHNKVKNCWAVRLAAGERPSLSSPISGGGVIILFRAYSNGATFPESDPPSAEPEGVNRQASAYKTTVGGNRMRVTTTSESDVAPYEPADNWVPTSGKSRNFASQLTSSNSIRTKTDGVIPDADYDQVPLRMFKADVGPAAWDNAFVLEDDDDTGGALPIDIGDDYTVNYAAFRGSSASGGTPTFDVNMELANNEKPANAVGADIWASTTAFNGKTYAVFGDGPNVGGRVSFGIANISGLSWDNMSISYLIGGPSPSVRAYVPKMAGFLADPDNINAIRAKALTALARGDYLLIPMMDQGAGTQGWPRIVMFRWNLNNMAADPEFGTAVWGTSQAWNKICPIFMQAGANMVDRFDEYIYMYSMDHNPIESVAGDSPHHYPAKIYLQRAPYGAHILDKDPWQWFTGTPDAPAWGTTGAAPTSATAIYTFPYKIDSRGSAFYNKKLNKVIVRWGHGLGTGLETSVPSFTRAFGPAAPWNRPVAGLTQHTDSATLSSRLLADGSVTPGDFNCTFSQYTYSVYEKDGSGGKPAATTTIQVSFTDHGHPTWGNVTEGTLVPWNPAWLPSGGFWAGSNAEDNWLIILDTSTGEEIDLWQVSLVSGKLQVGSANKIAGDYRTKIAPVASDIGARGCGIQNLAFLVRSKEVESGVIEHALGMPTRAESTPTAPLPFVSPAQKTDGNVNLGAVTNPGIPSGTRFYLNMTDTELDTWVAALPSALGTAGKNSARIIAQALRDYGWFISDSAGNAAHFQFEDYNSADWTALGLQPQTIGGKPYPESLLDGLITSGRLRAIVPSNLYPAYVPPEPASGEPTEGSQSRFVTLMGDRPWKLSVVDDTQITAPDVDPDLAQLNLVPHTLAPDGLSWVDATWGGDNSDAAIFFRTTVSTSGTGNGGTLTQITDGVRLTGLGLDEPLSGIRLFGRHAITKPFKIRYKFKRLVIPSSTDANGAFNFIGVLMPNSKAPNLNPSLWPSSTPTGDIEMANITTGWRIVHGNINTAGTAESNKFRLRWLDGNGGRIAINSADAEKIIDLGLNVVHEMELEWSADTVILRDINSGLSQTFRDSRLGTMTKGYLMFYTSPLMSAEFTDVRQIT
jgi:hypothetical protein